MTKSEIQDRNNIRRVQSLRANGHNFEFTVTRNNKGQFVVGMRAWARGDVNQDMVSISYCASFISAPHARAYIKTLEA